MFTESKALLAIERSCATVVCSGRYNVIESRARKQLIDIVKSDKKVQSSLIKDLTEVSVSKDEVDDAAYNTASTFSLGNNRPIVSQEIVSSKWTVYERISPESAQIVNKGNSDFCPQSVFRSRDRTNNDMTPTTSPHIAALKDRFGYHNHRDNGSGGEIITQFHTPSERFRPLVQKRCLHSPNTGDEQVMLTGELGFPCRQTVLPSSSIPKREIHIPVLFKSSAHYKQVFSACLAEHLNIIMYELSQRLHKAFSKVDMSFYTSSGDETLGNYNAAPICLHQQRAKLVMVRKEGPNKGRFFFACDASKARQCKFFKWLDELKVMHKERDKPESRVVLADMKSLSSYVRCQNISLYEESQLIIRDHEEDDDETEILDWNENLTFRSGQEEVGSEDDGCENTQDDDEVVDPTYCQPPVHQSMRSAEEVEEDASDESDDE
ncbi:unnamed protein product, partial [Ranitomeya imitator]